jgi:acylglycerol lipase
MFVQTTGSMHTVVAFNLFIRRCLSALLVASLSLGVGCAAQTGGAAVPGPVHTTQPSTGQKQAAPALPPTEQLLGRPFRVWKEPSPTLIVLGIHGFNDYSKAFAPLAEALQGTGARVYAYDQRGFGENADAGQWPGDEALITDIRQAATHLRRNYPGTPLVVIGESMGGALVLRAASEPGGLAGDALVLLAPAVWGMQIMPWYQRWSLELLNALAPDMTFTGRGIQHLGIRPTDDPVVSRDLSEDPFFIKETRVASLYGISQLMDKALAHPIRFPIPTLVMYGLNDRIIPPAPTCAWLSRLSLHSEKIPSHVEFIVYPEGWHMLTRQTRAEEVKKDLRDWLQALLVSKQPSPKIRHSEALPTTEKQPSSVSPSLAPARQTVCDRARGFR